MKATDLMLGDWVLCSLLPEAGFCEVCGMDAPTKSRKEYIMELTDQYGGRLWVYESFIKPIPLTPEILEKNGFVYNDLPYVQAWEQFGLALYSGGNGYRISCGNNVALIIESVHELQNALRLCGIEKEIVL